jgi:hypothetical protein
LIIHYITIAIVAIALPIAGATALKTVDGAPWYSWGLAIGGLVVMSAFVAIGWAMQPRFPRAFVAATLGVMMVAQALLLHGYKDTPSGRSDLKPLADLIRRDFPTPGPVINARTDPKRISVDLAIYLNRATERDPDWATRPLSDPPTIALVHQREGKPDPVIPPGWKLLGKIPRGADWYWALVQVAR